jgi:DNA-binding winged helix-turn-helix (wHTH) protein
MPPVYKETDFPIDYRQTQVRQVMNAVYRLRSVAITGLAGMGKSNLVRFIVSHPQVWSRYLQERARDTAFVHVDCAGLVECTETEILTEMVFQLQRERLGTNAVPAVGSAQDVRRTLKAQILDLEPELNLVLALDYFDEAAAMLDRSFFNFLFHLRNSRPRGNLCYVFAARRPLGHLGELQELLVDDCVVGPLSYEDALGSLQRDEVRLGCELDSAQRDMLITCAGGHPGFLKNAVELTCDMKWDRSYTLTELAHRFLKSDKVRNLCEELWADLTPTEQSVLLKVVQDLAILAAKENADVAFLLRNGILMKKANRRKPAIFGPLFEVFVQEKSAMPGTVRIMAVFPNQARLQTATREASVSLSPRLFALLQALSESPGQVVPTDELIARVYGDEAPGATNAALSQLVKRLRAALDSHVRKMTGDPAWTCVETIRDVGYRLCG